MKEQSSLENNSRRLAPSLSKLLHCFTMLILIASISNLQGVDAKRRFTPARTRRHHDLNEIQDRPHSQESLDRLLVDDMTHHLQSPKVEKFQNSIYYDSYFSDTPLADYFTAFYNGYNLQDYAFGEECFDNYYLFMDVIHEYNLNLTRAYGWEDPFLLSWDMIGNEFDDFGFYCFQLSWDIKGVYEKKADNFVDVGDIYLSFLFNLLSNSIHIKTASENMVEGYDIHDTAGFVENLARIVRIVADFNSYQSVGASFEGYLLATKSETKRIAEGRAPETNSIYERSQERAYVKERAHAKLAAHRHVRDGMKLTSAHQKSIADFGIEIPSRDETKGKLEPEGYVWTASDIAQTPFALFIGALNALPDESFGFKCSRNTTSSRKALIDSIDFFEIEEWVEGFTSLHESISFLAPCGQNCYYTFIVDLNEDHFLGLFQQATWWEIPVNLLYNAGYMYVDGVNYWFYNPTTVPGGEWGYFTLYMAGDIAMRIFYRDETPAY